ERISGRQLLSIIFIIHSTVVISILPSITTADVYQDAWLSSLVALVAVIAIALVILGLAVRFPRENMVQYSIRLLGPWAGRAVSLVYLWLFLQVAALETRFYADVLISGFLTVTPISFIVIVMVFASSVAAIAGIEVIARIADLFFALILILVISTLIIGLPKADFTLIQPVLARGWGPVLRGAVIPTTMAAHLGVTVFLAPSLVQPQKARTWVIGAVALAFLSMALFSIVTIIQLGPTEAARSVFPVMRMVRAVRISSFLERVEAISIFAWGLGIFIGLSTYIAVGAKGLAQVFNLSDYRPLVPPMAAIWVVLSVHLVQDVFQLRELLFYRNFGPYILFLLLIPVLALWLAWWFSPAGRRAGGGKKAGQKP
ncbi:MAG TPA: endospore germination permease, partial [Firmicutes bacterium]|nr:endospore germination permease [Bacillota bacterium]